MPHDGKRRGSFQSWGYAEVNVAYVDVLLPLLIWTSQRCKHFPESPKKLSEIWAWHGK